MQNNRKPLLTISLLASNRLDTIRRCLDSLQLISEKLPCELILVDTSKNDTIHNILLEYTDQVYEFEWCNDFSKARNVGLENAKGEWFLFIDDDEWFVDVEELIAFFTSGEYKNYGYANYQIRNFYDIHYINYSDGWVSRLVKIEEDTHFIGMVHEMFTPLRGACKDINAMVYHSGYIYQTEEQKQAHFERNASLLLEMITKEPWSIRWRMQLMQEYDVVQDWEKQIVCCEDALAKLTERNDAMSNLQRVSFYAGYTAALMNTDQKDKCITICKEIVLENKLGEVISALFQLRLANCFFLQKSWDDAIQYSIKYLCLYEKWHVKAIDFVKSNSVPYLGEIFGERNVKLAYSFLIVCDLKKGSISSLKEYYHKLAWEQASVYSDIDIETDFLYAMATMEEDEIFVRIATDIYRNRGLRSSMNIALQELDIFSKEFCKVMHILAKADADEGTVWFARACVADWNNDESGVIKAIGEFFKTAENVLEIPEKLCQIAERYDTNIYEYWREVTPRIWKEHCKQYWTKEQRKNSIEQELKKVFDTTEWRRRYFILEKMRAKVQYGLHGIDDVYLYYECIKKYNYQTLQFYHQYYRMEVFEENTQLLPGVVQAVILVEQYVDNVQMDQVLLLEKLEECRNFYVTVFEEKDDSYMKQEMLCSLETLLKTDTDEYMSLKELFYDFMIKTLEYYLNIFVDEAFTGEMEMLPQEALAAVWLNEFFCKEDDDFKGSMASLRECANVYPCFGEKVKIFAKLFAEEKRACEARVAQNANLEFQNMVEVMKVKIQHMVQQGLLQEAFSVLAQVRALAPMDTELRQLEEKLQER